jgi:hypothetical protein
MTKIKLYANSDYAPTGLILARARTDGTFDDRDEANTVLVQIDYDFPSVARNLGWSMDSIQVPGLKPFCHHESTDGTIDCSCGVKAIDFINAARQWINENDGAIADDPGYFNER